MAIQVLLLDGFDTAIIGTGLNAGGLECVVYDGYKVQNILRELEYPGSLEEFLAELETLSPSPPELNTPLFVFIDERDVDEDTAGRAGRIH